MALVRPYAGKLPRLHESAFALEGAVVIGDVEIGAESSLWFGTIVRGDVNAIRIGARTNVQDYTVVHVTGGTHPTTVGDEVTIGHRVTLHGCTVKDRCLVGIGAIVMDGAVVGEESIVGRCARVARHGDPAAHARGRIAGAREACARRRGARAPRALRGQLRGLRAPVRRRGVDGSMSRAPRRDAPARAGAER